MSSETHLIKKLSDRISQCVRCGACFESAYEHDCIHDHRETPQSKISDSQQESGISETPLVATLREIAQLAGTEECAQAADLIERQSAELATLRGLLGDVMETLRPAGLCETLTERIDAALSRGL